jgi:hypothetical protein
MGRKRLRPVPVIFSDYLSGRRRAAAARDSPQVQSLIFQNIDGTGPGDGDGHEHNVPARSQGPAQQGTVMTIRSKAAATVLLAGLLAADVQMASAALLPSDTTGCAPGARCIRVTSSGRPSASGVFVAQCRGRYPDFIAHRNAIPAGSTGKRFTPELIENATSNGPTTVRPWRNFDPRIPAERLAYTLALRNYAFSSRPVRALTPQLTAGTNYRDPIGGTVPQGQRDQRWYPAPRMIYGSPGVPGVREATHGMTLERTVVVNELGGNTAPLRNYAVAYYDRRCARTYRNTWANGVPGRDVADLTQMQMATDSLVFKLLFSAARPSDFPQDILQGSLAVDILPNSNTTPVNVRLLQVDIAVRDERAGTTGWYFATYAYDRSIASNSPWRKMVPVGLMWGNDPAGPPLTQTFINPAAPAYALAHLGVGGRLNGPVDNRASACMACHSTAQVPSVARIIPQGACDASPFREAWFRNLSGSTAFGHFENIGNTCNTSPVTPAPVAANYSLQLSATVSRSLPSEAATFNPCTWDAAAPPAELSATPMASGTPGQETPNFIPTRD